MRFCRIRNQIKETIPFKVLEILMAHQTPATPKPVAPNPMAKGTRNILKVILITAGGTVRPVP